MTGRQISKKLYIRKSMFGVRVYKKRKDADRYGGSPVAVLCDSDFSRVFGRGAIKQGQVYSMAIAVRLLRGKPNG